MEHYSRDEILEELQRQGLDKSWGRGCGYDAESPLLALLRGDTAERSATASPSAADAGTRSGGYVGAGRGAQMRQGCPGLPLSSLAPQGPSGCSSSSCSSSYKKDSKVTAAVADMIKRGLLPSRALRDVEQRPWKFLQGVYCINLDRRPERWNFMQKQFAALGLPARRFAAVDGRQVDITALAQGGLVSPKALPRFFMPDALKLFGCDLTPGGLGCALSHMQVWRHIVESDENSDGGMFLVVEDDCLFSAEFSEATLQDRIQQVPSDWQMIFLGGQDLLQRQSELQVAPGVRRLYHGFRETTAYLINVPGCKACLEVSVPLTWQIDTHLTENEVTIEGTDLRYTVYPMGYCLHPPVVNQERRLFGTDVQKNEHDE
eukprot:TRINITY_DN58344_c0_g1_i1.p1 TRINITY_DN58344_c0_g1~~TRINITY_DN58344_c0_g1_i1.p1  ORF type:complete len:398 (+),score=63.38 TRINITY_DN58344_c0_g1_i1:72-1196(+)